jgi:mannan endo-1,4-beta-mannosidase
MHVLLPYLHKQEIKMNIHQTMLALILIVLGLFSSCAKAEWTNISADLEVSQTRAQFDRINNNFVSYTNIKNSTAQPMSGPFRAVMVTTNIPSVSHDGKTDNGLPYVLFAQQTLAANQTIGIKINFEYQRVRLVYDVVIQQWQTPEVSRFNLVIPNATAETVSLFAAMQQTTADQIMFGHQHETTQGLSMSDFSGYESDTFNTVGDFAAVVGWDTLSIIKHLDQNGNLIASEGDIFRHVRLAYQRGSITTISGHFDNKSYAREGGQTGSSWDNRVSVKHVLPGGKDHESYKGDLDQLADWLNTMTVSADDPTLIPIVLRLLHENTGSWFWWGKQQCTPEEYKNLFRFTVEYLRDVKQVRNVLIEYSPNEDAGVNQQTYLERYPGDEYVDVLGFDSYGAPNDSVWLANVVRAAATVSTMAQSRGKIAAIAEIGISSGKIGNEELDTDWYGTLLSALKSDPDAMKVSYMLVWRNGSYNHFWVPYVGPYNHGESAGLAAKIAESVIDFQAFYNNPATLFNNDLAKLYQLENVTTIDESPYAYILSPTRYTALAQNGAVYVGIGFEQPQSVSFSVGEQSISLSQVTGSGYYQGLLDTSTFIEDSLMSGLMTVTLATGDVLSQSVDFLYDQYTPAADVSLVDDFEGYFGLDELLLNEYSFTSGDPASAYLSSEHKNSGNYGLKFQYDLAQKGWTGMTHSNQQTDSPLNWIEFNTLNLWLKPDNLSQRLVIQMKTANGYWEAYKVLGNDASITTSDVNPLHGDASEIEQITTPTLLKIPFSSFIRPAWDSSVGSIDVAEIQQINFYINALAADARPELPITINDSAIYLDDIQASYIQGNGDYSSRAELEFDFEYSNQGWQGQIDWSGNTAVFPSANWSQDGDKSLQGLVDLTNVSGAYVMQVFGEFDVSNITSLSLYVNAINAGAGVRAKLFVKDSNWTWSDGGQVTLQPNGNRLDIDLSQFAGLKSVGVLFQGFDNTKTAAEFFVDTVRPVRTSGNVENVLFDFETALNGWHGQINWSGSAATSLSANWAAVGSKAAQTIVDISAGVNSFAMQVFKDIDTSNMNTISVTVNTRNAGQNVSAKLFIKDQNWGWQDAGSVSVDSNGTTLTIDVSQLNAIKSIGVQFSGFDPAGNAAEFYVDDVNYQ